VKAAAAAAAGSSAAGLTTVAKELERFFFDQCDLFVKSGKGGQGALSSVGSRPAGGNGGNGGAVYVEVVEGFTTLIHLPGKNYAGKDGDDANQRESGATGADCVIKVPPNCVVSLRDTNETLGTLVEPGERLLICKGGIGGRGNGASGKQDRVSPPTSGRRMWLSFQMTLVADIGLIGLPNAGKVCALHLAPSQHKCIHCFSVQNC
jgi:GTPase